MQDIQGEVLFLYRVNKSPFYQLKHVFLYFFPLSLNFQDVNFPFKCVVIIYILCHSC